MAYKQAHMIDATNALATESLAFAAAAIGERAAVLYETLIATGPAPNLFGSYADVLLALDRPAGRPKQHSEKH